MIKPTEQQAQMIGDLWRISLNLLRTLHDEAEPKANVALAKDQGRPTFRDRVTVLGRPAFARSWMILRKAACRVFGHKVIVNHAVGTTICARCGKLHCF